MRILILALALTGCAKPAVSALQCTVDDSLSFTMENVTKVSPSEGTLIITRADGPTIVRNMLPGETCEPVAKINWELAL